MFAALLLPLVLVFVALVCCQLMVGEFVEVMVMVWYALVTLCVVFVLAVQAVIDQHYELRAYASWTFGTVVGGIHSLH